MAAASPANKYQPTSQRVQNPGPILTARPSEPIGERLYKQALTQTEYKNRLKDEYLKKKIQDERATLTFTPQLNSRSLKMISPSRRAADNNT